MKTKWMCMILMLALAFHLSACGNRQENGNSSENRTINMEPQSEEDSWENTGNESNDTNVINQQDNGTDKNMMAVSKFKDSAFSGKVSGCYYAAKAGLGFIITGASQSCYSNTWLKIINPYSLLANRILFGKTEFIGFVGYPVQSFQAALSFTGKEDRTQQAILKWRIKCLDLCTK